MSWYVRSHICDPNKILEDVCAKYKAPMANRFNNHQWCDSSQCWTKDFDDKEIVVVIKNISEINEIILKKNGNIYSVDYSDSDGSNSSISDNVDINEDNSNGNDTYMDDTNEDIDDLNSYSILLLFYMLNDCCEYGG